MTNAKAIVCRGKQGDGGWKLEEVKLRPLERHEVLVRIVACGICHTDLIFGDYPEICAAWPKVMGHEGSGYVEKFGSAVTGLEVGDPVLLSYASCEKCKMCTDGQLAHCIDNWNINFHGTQVFHSSASKSISGEAPSEAPGEAPSEAPGEAPSEAPGEAPGEAPDIAGSFFGQSSFASLTVVDQSSVVNVKGLVSHEELKLFAPLGCGIQTGSGTILNVADAKPSDSVAVIGAGGVGLAAVMAARIAGCGTIIIIDRVPSRLALAQELGATHTINTTGMVDLQEELVLAVRDVTDGYGASIVMDATGVMPLIRAGVEFTASCGQYIQVGSTAPTDVLSISTKDFMTLGKSFKGAVIGKVKAREFVPKMIQWYREGRFPFDRLVKFYEAQMFEEAIGDMHHGDIVKPVLIW